MPHDPRTIKAPPRWEQLPIPKNAKPSDPLGAMRQMGARFPMRLIRIYSTNGSMLRRCKPWPRGSNCEPVESRKGASAIRRALIQTAGGTSTSGVTPTRAVAENLAGDGGRVMHTHTPDSHMIKRSAQNAPYGAQKRAKADGEGGVVANYRSMGFSIS